MPDEKDKSLTDEEEVPATPAHARLDDRPEDVEEGDSSDDVGDSQSGGPAGKGSHDEEE